MIKKISALSELPYFAHLEGAGADEISAAQDSLRVEFASDYAEYVSAYGIASANGHELTGVCKFPRLSVVKVTEEERGRGHGEDPGWYVIEQAGIDDLVAWQSPNGEVFMTSPGGTPEKVANSLLEYMQL